MILYKYFSFKSGLKVLLENKLNFSFSKYFNDPFECTATYPIPTDVHRIIERKQVYDELYKSSYGILSLTRTPLNCLMWAHYGEHHKGIVIGFNVDQDVFTNEKTCTVPVQHGSVIYTATKPKFSIVSSPNMEPGMWVHQEHSAEKAELLQRLFLYKSVDWSYEEEVRVVKCFGEDGLHPDEDSEIYVE